MRKKLLLIMALSALSIKGSFFMDKDAKVYVAGHRGLVGSALIRKLEERGFTNVLTRTTQELDLRNQQAVNDFFVQEKPDYVFLAAAKVGGIMANKTYPAEFMYDNLAIELNVIHAAYKSKVKKLLFLGSSCIYPRDCPQPIKEEYLLSGQLEATNEAYALAKIAGLKMCRYYREQYGVDFISCMPTNLYGPGDNFDLQNSHVLPALIRKCFEAKRDNKKEIIVWGTGKPCREFLYVDDLADASLFLMNNYSDVHPVNIGTGVDLTIAQLVQEIKQVIGFEGDIVFDTTKPDGTPKKQLDVSVLHGLGWHAPTGLKQGLQKTVDWCKATNRFN